MYPTVDKAINIGNEIVYIYLQVKKIFFIK